jgi:hypothetical protein
MKSLIGFLLVLALSTSARAGTTTVEDFRGTVQTVTSTGTVTLSLSATTTIVRVNSASDVFIVGMTGGYDGRIVFFTTAGAGNAYFYQEHSSAATAADRFMQDANGTGGFRVIYNGGKGFGMAIYDGTTQRWRFASMVGFNSGGPLTANGDFVTSGSIQATNGLIAGDTTLRANTPTRLILKATHATNDGSTVRWQDKDAANLWSMGNDYWGNGGHDFWLYDSVNNRDHMYLSPTGTSFLRFGSSWGGMQYEDADNTAGGDGLGRLSFMTDGYIGADLHDYAWRFHRHVFYTRYNSGSSLPARSANCAGSSTSSAHADSGDERGSVTLGTGATACTLTFAVPWDLDQSPANGVPVCTANSSVGYVKVTAIDDHTVTFTPGTTGAQTIYYHCDGIIDPL